MLQNNNNRYTIEKYILREDKWGSEANRKNIVILRYEIIPFCHLSISQAESYELWAESYELWDSELIPKV